LPEFQIGALRLTSPYVGILILGPIAIASLTCSSGGAGSVSRSALGCQPRRGPDERHLGEPHVVAHLGDRRRASACRDPRPSGAGLRRRHVRPPALLKALAAAVLARMVSLPIALLGGAAIGVVEQVLLWHYPLGGGIVDVVLYVVILVRCSQRTLPGREDDREAGPRCKHGGRFRRRWPASARYGSCRRSSPGLRSPSASPCHSSSRTVPA
jgi:hypothetical protein